MNPLYKIAPYGEFSHAKGIQFLHRQALEKMAKRFSRDPFRLFGRKVKLYLGHPDEPNPEGEVPSLRHLELGYVKRLEVNDEGLYAEIVWHRLGELELQVNRPLYFSPRWRMKPCDSPQGDYEPYRLLSVGLVELPNLTGVDCANPKNIITFSQEMKHSIKTTSETLNLGLSGTLQSKRKAKPILNCIESFDEADSDNYLERWGRAKRKFINK